MKLRFKLLLLVLLANNYFIAAQKTYYKVRVGKEIKQDKLKEIIILGGMDDHAYYLKIQNDDAFLSMVDLSMKPIKSVSLTTIIGSNDIVYGSFLGESLFLFSKNDEKGGFFAHLINTTTLKEEQTKQLIDYSSLKKGNISFEFEKSANGENLLISLYKFGNDKSRSFWVSRMDKDFKIGETHNFKDFIKDEKIDEDEIAISNDGTSYVLLKIDAHADEKFDRDYNWALYQINKDETVKSIKLPMLENDKRYLNLIVLNNNNLVLFGYTATSDAKKPSHVFTYLIKDGVLVKENKWKPDYKYFASCLDAKEKEKLKKDMGKEKSISLGRFLHPEVFVSETNEVYIVGQNIVTNMSSSKLTVSGNTYFSNISVYKLNDSGEVIWGRIIAQNQILKNTSSSGITFVKAYSNRYPLTGYGAAFEGGKILILSNKHKDSPQGNIDIESRYQYNFGRKAKMTLAIISEDGKIKEKNIFNETKIEQYGIIPDPFMIRKVGDKTYLFTGYDKLSKKVAKLMKFYIELK